MASPPETSRKHFVGGSGFAAGDSRIRIQCLVVLHLLQQHVRLISFSCPQVIGFSCLESRTEHFDTSKLEDLSAIHQTRFNFIAVVGDWGLKKVHVQLGNT